MSARKTDSSRSGDRDFGTQETKSWKAQQDLNTGVLNKIVSTPILLLDIQSYT